MKKSNTLLLKGIALTMLFACFTSMVSAQIFWDEDFADGIPADWTNEDLSSHGAVWTWCDDPAAGAGGGCPAIFDDAINMQSPFAGPTATTGFVTIDSDGIAATAGNPHISELTTPAIDCSGQSEVYLSFNAHIGVYDLDAETNALLQVSINGADWIDYTIFPGLDTGERWSDNPEEVVVNLTDFVAGESTVYLRWHWTAGWEYFWNMDDIFLTSENPIDPHDMRVNDNFFASAPNYGIPASQVEAFGFIADIENIGSVDQTGVSLNVTVVDDSDPGTNLYDQTLDYGTVLAGELIENQLFPDDGFTPGTTVGTNYTGTYTITADSVDMDSSDNVRTFPFTVTDGVFQKDFSLETSGGTRPADGEWDAATNEPWSWAWGNHYHVPNGDGMYATEAMFALGNAGDIPGAQMFIKLYEWDDTSADSNCDPDERTWVGYSLYTVDGTEGTDILITVPILNVSNDEPGIAMEDGSNYVLMLEYTASDNATEVFFMSNQSIDFGAAIFRSQELMEPRLGGMLGIGEPLSSEIYSYVGFGTDNVPVVRMGISDTPTAVDDILDDNNTVSAYPNPATDFINVDIDLVEMHETVMVEVTDLTGKLVSHQRYSDFQSDLLQVDVSQLAAGSYYLSVVTPDGQKTTKFAVQR